jgi:hypothetical protein
LSFKIQHHCADEPVTFIKRIAQSEYVRSAVADKADLSALRRRPVPRTILGIAIIGLSYTIGWPAIGVLAAASVYLNRPLLLAVGGPILYGLSHLVFMAGTVLAGADYARIFLRWGTRVLAEKWMDKKTESV